MASTYTQILYHIVFSVKDRRPAIVGERRKDLYAYIWGIHKQLNCHMYRIGGVEDHVHILVSLHPMIALSRLVREVKTGSTGWIRREGVFDRWPGWQDGYAAITASISERDAIVQYIKGQVEHHRKVSFLDEYRKILTDAGIRFDERYLV